MKKQWPYLIVAQGNDFSDIALKRRAGGIVQQQQIGYYPTLRDALAGLINFDLSALYNRQLDGGSETYYPQVQIVDHQFTPVARYMYVPTPVREATLSGLFIDIIGDHQKFWEEVGTKPPTSRRLLMVGYRVPGGYAHGSDAQWLYQELQQNTAASRKVVELRTQELLIDASPSAGLGRIVNSTYHYPNLNDAYKDFMTTDLVMMDKRSRASAIEPFTYLSKVAIYNVYNQPQVELVSLPSAPYAVHQSSGIYLRSFCELKNFETLADTSLSWLSGYDPVGNLLQLASLDNNKRLVVKPEVKEMAAFFNMEASGGLPDAAFCLEQHWAPTGSLAFSAIPECYQRQVRTFQSLPAAIEGLCNTTPYLLDMAECELAGNLAYLQQASVHENSTQRKIASIHPGDDIVPRIEIYGEQAHKQTAAAVLKAAEPFIQSGRIAHVKGQAGTNSQVKENRSRKRPGP